MDLERQRLQEDLRGLIVGDVRCDDLFVQLYASDASIYQIRPLGVVRPRHTDDVVACVQYAAENKIPIHARGAGTGLAGESIGPGLVIDFSRYMRRIVEVGEDTVIVQPGVVHALLNQALHPYGRLFGPDPAMSQVTTMGSVVAIDGSGSHRLLYGSARDQLVRVKAVLASGEVVSLGREPLRVDPPTGSNGGNGDGKSKLPARQLVEPIAELIRSHQRQISDARRRCPVDRSGYQVSDILDQQNLDVARLLCGSEGTLALFTELTVRTSPLPRHTGVALVFFDHLEKAAQAVQELLPLGPAACDIMDRRHLSLARENDVRYDLLIPEDAEAMLLLESTGPSAGEARDRLTEMVEAVSFRSPLAFHCCIASDAEEESLYWQLARRVVPTLYSLRGSSRPIPFIEDLAVPPAALPDFLVRLQNIFKQHQVTASLFGHAGHGQLHVRPFLNLADPDDVGRMQALAEDVYVQVIDAGGTISGEHGDGLSRSWYLRRQHGELYDLFRGIKRIFDPHNVLNPGKKVDANPDALTDHLRVVSPVGSPGENGQVADENTADGPELIDLQLHWTTDEIALAARNCNGCGACRSQLAEVRMCPIFRFAPAEEASPRAKANLIRGVLTGALEPGVVAQDEFKRVADLCVNCHQCRLECPAGVDIPRLMIEAKAAYVRTNGLRPAQWWIGRLDVMCGIGGLFPPLTNWALSNRIARWTLERLVGLAQGRKLPRFARQTFLRRAAQQKLTRPVGKGGQKVLYFVDTYANHNDPQLAQSLVDVLEHNGVSVYVHPEQRYSAMALISTGALDAARKVVEHNVRLLADAVRQGYHIVATEPAAALCLTHEYVSLLGSDDARLVADNSSEACTFLWRMHQAGKLRLDFRPVNATLGYHLPCHVKALEVGTPGEHLLRLIPGLKVIRTERGCSGMAGTFGMKRANYRRSLRAGWGLITAMRDPTLHGGATECSGCKMQMEQGTTKPTIHPLKLLALSYGLWGDEPSPLAARSGELVVT